MYFSEFGLKVRIEMMRRGITMTQLAKELGVSVSYVSDILRGVREGKPQQQKIVDILGLDWGEEVAGENHG